MKIQEIEQVENVRRINSAKKWSRRQSPPPRFPDFFDKGCHYMTALWASLLQIRPRYCLEIGTHDGLNSTRIFTEYLEKYQPDGILITVDIVPCKSPLGKNVRQVIAVPHHEKIESTCGGNGWINKGDLLDSINLSKDSVEINSERIMLCMKDLQIEQFDFAFIDGDHERVSLLRDIEICESLLSDRKLMMIDDTKEEVHPCCHVYHDEIKTSGKYECYDFEDWEKFVGMSLISKKP